MLEGILFSLVAIFLLTGLGYITFDRLNGQPIYFYFFLGLVQAVSVLFWIIILLILVILVYT